MTPKYEYERVFHGILIQYDKCSHCGLAPTNEQIEDQIAISMNYIEIPCRICGLKPKILEMTLHHTKDEGIDSWGASSYAAEPMTTLMVHGGKHSGVQINVHPHCLEKAMPHIVLNKGTGA